jgi:hypothetical protein
MTPEPGSNSRNHILRETNLSSSLILPESTVHGWRCDTAWLDESNVGDRQRGMREKLCFALVVFFLLVAKVLR